MLVGLLASGVLLSSGGAAWAVIAELPSGLRVSYMPPAGQAPFRPFDQLFANVEYGGGPVMTSNTNYTVYWAPPGAPAYPPEYEAGVNRFFEDLAHDGGGHENVDSVVSQYNETGGAFANYSSHFGGALIDEDPYPPSGCTQAPKCLTAEQIANELERFVTAHKLPTGLADEYFLLTPPGIEDCFEASGGACSAGTSRPAFCAYHSATGPPGEFTSEQLLIYSNDPFVTGNERCDDGNHPNGSSSDGALSLLSHEHSESLSDPAPGFGWVSFGESGLEIGDKCRTSFESSEFGTPLGEVEVGGKRYRYNQLINGHPYWLQQEWSNSGHRCLQRLTPSAAQPTAKFTSAPGSGTEVTFDASQSSAPGGVARYSWQFGDGSNPVETVTPTISHNFPRLGGFLVALTVYAKDGTGNGTAQLAFAEPEEPPIAIFSWRLSSSTPSQIVIAFDASPSIDPDGTITSYAWDFGDGSTGTGVAPTHAYASPGSYLVKLTVTDSSGNTETRAQQVPVSRLPEPSCPNGATPQNVTASGYSCPGAAGGTPSLTALGQPTAAASPRTQIIAVAAARANATLQGRFTLPGVVISCGVGPCSVQAVARGTLPGSVKTAAGGHKRHQGTLKLGSAALTLASAQSAPLTLTLNPVARASLLRYGSLKASIVVIVTDALGHRDTTTVFVTIVAPRRPRHH